MYTQQSLYCLAQLSLTPVQARAEPMGNSSSPCRRVVYRRTDSRMKTVMKTDSRERCK